MMITKEDYEALKRKEEQYSAIVKAKARDRAEFLFNASWIASAIVPFTSTLVWFAIKTSLTSGLIFFGAAIWGLVFLMLYSYPRSDFLKFENWYSGHIDREQQREEIKKLKKNAKERRVLIAMYEAEKELQNDIEKKNKALADDFSARLKNNR